ncbi:MAG: phenylalanine--tRNA ligase subunit alpha [Thermosphaera aggregans]|jgi:phenylalanyl-tRNA synthetase alpha chain|uniref:phenylalanine--tRNA ligase subunit alpha n=1 Tax=Thermosphaera aggregans TaxID=54254 RepID=UPI003C07C1C1
MTGEVYLTPRQSKIVSLVLSGVNDLEKISQQLGVKPEDIMRDITELANKGLLMVHREVEKRLKVTRIGRLYMEKGLPEKNVLKYYGECVDKTVEAITNCLSEKTGLDRDEISIGIQYVLKAKCGKIVEGSLVIEDPLICQQLLTTADRVEELLRNIDREIKIPVEDATELKKRRMVEIVEKRVLRTSPTPLLQELNTKGLIKEKEIITVVKPSMVFDLNKYVIKEFDPSVPVPKVPSVRKHPFMEFIDDLRDIMVSLGFEEVKGPHVEAEFWNFDVLYQAQDHPAREIHDTFFVKSDARASISSQLMERARSVHEKGWGYKWSPERAMRLVLRSQTTAVSARAIFERGEGEYRVFTIDRVFRPENLDAKHSMEFYQLDGIIVGENVNFKHLLYFFKELVAALGIKEVWFKPGYFPFTEPSVEGYIKHPKLGWVEVFPGGVFRPEVMEILGAPGVKAVAWGIGVDRLAMQVLGIDDIRMLFATDLEVLKNMKYLGLPHKFSKTSGRDVKVAEYPE